MTGTEFELLDSRQKQTLAMPSPTGRRRTWQLKEEDDIFEVDRILDRRIVRGRSQYLIRWKGFDDSEEDTWEPQENLVNVLDMVKKFEEKSKSPAKGRTRSRSRGRKSSPAKKAPSKPRRSASKSRSTSRGRPPGRSRSRGRSKTPTRKPKEEKKTSPPKTSTPKELESPYLRPRPALKPLTSTAGETPPRSSARLAIRAQVANSVKSPAPPIQKPQPMVRMGRVESWWNRRKQYLPLIIFTACLLIVAGTLVYYKRDSINETIEKWKKRSGR